MNISVKRVGMNAVLPFQARPRDAAYDLFSTEDYWLKPGERHVFLTNLAIAIPDGYVGLIWDRSGLAAKQGITVLAGIVDSTFRGNVGVVLLNTNQGDESQSVKISSGDRIAQMIVQQCERVEWQEVDTLPDSVRGSRGWGSSGS